MLESNVWGENSFPFIHKTWIGNDLLKIRKINRAELILKIVHSSAISLAAILKTRSARRLARGLLPAFLCAHIEERRLGTRQALQSVAHDQIRNTAQKTADNNQKFRTCLFHANMKPMPINDNCNNDNNNTNTNNNNDNDNNNNNNSVYLLLL